MELQALHTALATVVILAWFAILLGWMATYGLDEHSRKRPEARTESFSYDRETVMPVSSGVNRKAAPVRSYGIYQHHHTVLRGPRDTKSSLWMMDRQTRRQP